MSFLITMAKTIQPLTSFCSTLQDNPVEAAESDELQQLIQLDRFFYHQLAAEDRWRLLFGLTISLLDFSDGIDLNTHFLPLPGGFPSLSLWQLCDSLVCVDFQLDSLDWAEELDLKHPLTIAELDTCAAVLSAPETLERLDSLIAEGLSLIETCDEFPLKPSESAVRPQGWLRKLWTSLRRMEG